MAARGEAVRTGARVSEKYSSQRFSRAKHPLIFFGALLFFACCLVTNVATSAERAQGVLEIRIKDHRDAIGDFARLNIIIDQILISPNVGLRIWQTGWQELTASPHTIDLTKYIGKTSAKVFRSNIEAGSFEAFHLKLKGFEAVLKKGPKSVPVKNTIGPVKLSFAVLPKGETVLVIDLTVVDLSDHPPRGYELGVRGYELYTNGKLISKIPPG
jgi:hypothetical protein